MVELNQVEKLWYWMNHSQLEWDNSQPKTLHSLKEEVMFGKKVNTKKQLT